MTSLLRLEDVNVWFGGVRAVDGVSLELEPGRLYGLVGPNGSGKTTLVNAISRLTPLTSGTIWFDGRDVGALPAHAVARAGVARTFQLIRLIPTLTVRENVLLGADIHRLDGDRRARMETAADEALERLGIARLAHVRPGGLPYGTQRRVEIARALAMEPKLLLLDEPVAGSNRGERDELAAIIAELRDHGLTQLLIEHDLRTMLRICDHLFVMNFGRCVAEGEPKATAALPIVQEAYLGRRNVPA
jgi:branched-chain amino acid transport system ATP-binding protein